MQVIQGKKYLWQLPVYDSLQVAQLAASFNISYPVVQAALARGYTTYEEIYNFLFSPKEENVYHASLLKDADKAIDRLLLALERKEKILIAGDYDVDGITSSALFMSCLLPLDARVNFFLPHRVHDGYGLSVKTVRRAVESGYSLIITVDNGITAFDAAREAKALGIDLIITDHHRPHAELPDAYAIIDPYQEGCAYPFKKFAGVGVSFKLISLLYERLGKSLPESVYELLLLGTVADVVPLRAENRFWVRHGLQLLNQQTSHAVTVLRTNVSVTKSALTATDIGFFITPQINALGRLEDPRDGVKFLIGSDKQETERIGKVLGQLNQARKNIERSIIESITQSIESGALDLNDPVLIASSNDWPPGVIGLVAGKIASSYGRPVILLHTTSSGVAKGSCRSIPALNMFEALESVKDLLISFGGHAQAAGLSLQITAIPELKQRLCTYINARLTPEDFKQKLILDGALSLQETSRKLVDELAYLEPFGCENPKPLFLIKKVNLVERPQLLKEAHVKCLVTADGIIKPIIFFNRPDIFELFNEHYDEPFDVVVSVSENEWQGRVTIEFQGFDIAY